MNASGIIQSIIFPPQEKVIFGPGCVNQLADEVDGLLKKRALVITGPTIAKKTDLLRRVQQILGPRLVGVFFPISQHVPRSNVVAATSRARETKADILISLGGSSPVDGTKAVALCLSEGIVSRDQFDGYRKGDPHQKPIQGQAIPHIAITTTLSAGEFTCGFDITDERHQVKEIYRAPQFIPRIVILDPEMTVSTPPMALGLNRNARGGPCHCEILPGIELITARPYPGCSGRFLQYEPGQGDHQRVLFD